MTDSMPPVKYSNDPTFCKLMDHVFKSEGGYVNDPLDPGGPTYMGISWRYHHKYFEDLGIFDVKDIPPDVARQFYYTEFWIMSGANGITSTALAYIHFDAAVNCGPSIAKILLSRLAGNPKTMDGRDGKNAVYFRGQCMDYAAQRLRYYTKCHNWAHDGAGWANRMADVLNTAVQLST